jgi:hypothetical protein
VLELVPAFFVGPQKTPNVKIRGPKQLPRFHSDEAIVIESERVPLPLTIFPPKAALNPWLAILINHPDAQRPLASKQFLVNSHGFWKNDIAFLKELRRYLSEPNSVPDF